MILAFDYMETDPLTDICSMVISVVLEATTRSTATAATTPFGGEVGNDIIDGAAGDDSLFGDGDRPAVTDSDDLLHYLTHRRR